VHLCLLLEMLLSHSQRNHVVVELGLVADADRADQLTARFTVHRQWFLVLFTFNDGYVSTLTVIFLPVESRTHFFSIHNR